MIITPIEGNSIQQQIMKRKVAKNRGASISPESVNKINLNYDFTSQIYLQERINQMNLEKTMNQTVNSQAGDNTQTHHFQNQALQQLEMANRGSAMGATSHMVQGYEQIQQSSQGDGRHQPKSKFSMNNDLNLKSRKNSSQNHIQSQLQHNGQQPQFKLGIEIPQVQNYNVKGGVQAGMQPGSGMMAIKDYNNNPISMNQTQKMPKFMPLTNNSKQMQQIHQQQYAKKGGKNTGQSSNSRRAGSGGYQQIQGLPTSTQYLQQNTMQSAGLQNLDSTPNKSQLNLLQAMGTNVQMSPPQTINKNQLAQSILNKKRKSNIEFSLNNAQVAQTVDNTSSPINKNAIQNQQTASSKNLHNLSNKRSNSQHLLLINTGNIQNSGTHSNQISQKNGIIAYSQNDSKQGQSSQQKGGPKQQQKYMTMANSDLQIIQGQNQKEIDAKNIAAQDKKEGEKLLQSDANDNNHGQLNNLKVNDDNEPQKDDIQEGQQQQTLEEQKNETDELNTHTIVNSNTNQGATLTYAGLNMESSDHSKIQGYVLRDKKGSYVVLNQKRVSYVQDVTGQNIQTQQDLLDSQNACTLGNQDLSSTKQYPDGIINSMQKEEILKEYTTYEEKLNQVINIADQKQSRASKQNQINLQSDNELKFNKSRTYQQNSTLQNSPNKGQIATTQELGQLEGQQFISPCTFQLTKDSKTLEQIVTNIELLPTQRNPQTDKDIVYLDESTIKSGFFATVINKNVRSNPGSILNIQTSPTHQQQYQQYQQQYQLSTLNNKDQGISPKEGGKSSKNKNKLNPQYYVKGSLKPLNFQSKQLNGIMPIKGRRLSANPQKNIKKINANGGDQGKHFLNIEIKDGIQFGQAKMNSASSREQQIILVEQEGSDLGSRKLSVVQQEQIKTHSKLQTMKLVDGQQLHPNQQLNYQPSRQQYKPMNYNSSTINITNQKKRGSPKIRHLESEVMGSNQNQQRMTANLSFQKKSGKNKSQMMYRTAYVSPKNASSTPNKIIPQSQSKDGLYKGKAFYNNVEQQRIRSSEHSKALRSSKQNAAQLKEDMKTVKTSERALLISQMQVAYSQQSPKSDINHIQDINKDLPENLKDLQNKPNIEVQHFQLKNEDVNINEKDLQTKINTTLSGINEKSVTGSKSVCGQHERNMMQQNSIILDDSSQQNELIMVRDGLKNKGSTSLGKQEDIDKKSSNLQQKEGDNQTTESNFQRSSNINEAMSQGDLKNAVTAGGVSQNAFSPHRIGDKNFLQRDLKKNASKQSKVSSVSITPSNFNNTHSILKPKGIEIFSNVYNNDQSIDNCSSENNAHGNHKQMVMKETSQYRKSSQGNALQPHISLTANGQSIDYRNQVILSNNMQDFQNEQIMIQGKSTKNLQGIEYNPKIIQIERANSKQSSKLKKQVTEEFKPNSNEYNIIRINSSTSKNRSKRKSNVKSTKEIRTTNIDVINNNEITVAQKLDIDKKFVLDDDGKINSHRLTDSHRSQIEDSGSKKILSQESSKKLQLSQKNRPEIVIHSKSGSKVTLKSPSKIQLITMQSSKKLMGVRNTNQIQNPASITLDQKASQLITPETDMKAVYQNTPGTTMANNQPFANTQNLNDQLNQNFDVKDPISLSSTFGQAGAGLHSQIKRKESINTLRQPTDLHGHNNNVQSNQDSMSNQQRQNDQRNKMKSQGSTRSSIKLVQARNSQNYLSLQSKQKLQSLHKLQEQQNLNGQLQQQTTSQLHQHNEVASNQSGSSVSYIHQKEQGTNPLDLEQDDNFSEDPGNNQNYIKMGQMLVGQHPLNNIMQLQGNNPAEIQQHYKAIKKLELSLSPKKYQNNYQIEFYNQLIGKNNGTTKDGYPSGSNTAKNKDCFYYSKRKQRIIVRDVKGDLKILQSYKSGQDLMNNNMIKGKHIKTMNQKIQEQIQEDHQSRRLRCFNIQMHPDMTGNSFYNQEGIISINTTNQFDHYNKTPNFSQNNPDQSQFIGTNISNQQHNVQTFRSELKSTQQMMNNVNNIQNSRNHNNTIAKNDHSAGSTQLKQANAINIVQDCQESVGQNSISQHGGTPVILKDQYRHNNVSHNQDLASRMSSRQNQNEEDITPAENISKFMNNKYQVQSNNRDPIKISNQDPSPVANWDKKVTDNSNNQSASFNQVHQAHQQQKQYTHPTISKAHMITLQNYQTTSINNQSIISKQQQLLMNQNFSPLSMQITQNQNQTDLLQPNNNMEQEEDLLSSGAPNPRKQNAVSNFTLQLKQNLNFTSKQGGTAKGQQRPTRTQKQIIALREKSSQQQRVNKLDGQAVDRNTLCNANQQQKGFQTLEQMGQFQPGMRNTMSTGNYHGQGYQTVKDRITNQRVRKNAKSNVQMEFLNFTTTNNNPDGRSKQFINGGGKNKIESREGSTCRSNNSKELESDRNVKYDIYRPHANIEVNKHKKEGTFPCQISLSQKIGGIRKYRYEMHFKRISTASKHQQLKGTGAYYIQSHNGLKSNQSAGPGQYQFNQVYQLQNSMNFQTLKQQLKEMGHKRKGTQWIDLSKPAIPIVPEQNVKTVTNSNAVTKNYKNSFFSKVSKQMSEAFNNRYDVLDQEKSEAQLQPKLRGQQQHQQAQYLITQ